jgi:hypothetical protein
MHGTESHHRSPTGSPMTMTTTRRRGMTDPAVPTVWVHSNGHATNHHHQFQQQSESTFYSHAQGQPQPQVVPAMPVYDAKDHRFYAQQQPFSTAATVDLMDLGVNYHHHQHPRERSDSSSEGGAAAPPLAHVWVAPTDGSHFAHRM